MTYKGVHRPKIPLAWPAFRNKENDILHVCEYCRRGVWCKPRTNNLRNMHFNACNRSMRLATDQELVAANEILEAVI